MLRSLLAGLLAGVLPGTAFAAPISILLLGDSITEGRQTPPFGASYGELLQQSLGTGFEVESIGCGGASALDWTQSHASAYCGGQIVPPGLYAGLALPQLPADLVSLLLGTNDALGFFELERTPAAIYRTAIAEIAANLLADGAGRVLLLTPPPQFWQPQSDPYLQGYRDAILELCGAPGDALLCGPDLYTLLAVEDFGDENIHPSALGHAKLAAALHDAVLEAVPEPGSALLLAAGLAALAGRRRGRGAARTD